MSKSDINTLKRGLKRVGVALITTLSFALCAAGFILTAFIPGYAAVLVFIASIIVLLFSVSLLYAQGVNPQRKVGKPGEGK